MARILICSGFLWIALWATVGSLLGARINQALLTQDTAWIASLQRELLRTAHAHMNTMSYGLILMGVTYVAARREVSEKATRMAALAALFGTVLFGAGLVGEAFSPTTSEGVSAATALSVVGGLGVILSFGAWGVYFLRSATRP